MSTPKPRSSAASRSARACCAEEPGVGEAPAAEEPAAEEPAAFRTMPPVYCGRCARGPTAVASVLSAFTLLLMSVLASEIDNKGKVNGRRACVSAATIAIAATARAMRQR